MLTVLSRASVLHEESIRVQPHIPNFKWKQTTVRGVPRDDSETDDLRGVIDDLTVENKRLKQLLRRWRGRKSFSMAYGDKLFEVRMHGLPPGRK
jgi:Frequency clock protein